jgi:hypothetical protein
MYRYNMMGNQNSLFVDSTDSFFNRGDSDIVFGTQITDMAAFDVASDIVRHIPDQLLASTKPAEVFGCPDCTDGCGIYFEILKDGMVRKFYIDYQTHSLTGEIKRFAEYLKGAIPRISSG